MFSYAIVRMLSYFGDLLTKVFYHDDKLKKEEFHLDEYDIIERSTSPTNNSPSIMEKKEETTDIFIPNTKKILDTIIYDNNRFKIFNRYRAIQIKKYECNFSKHKLMIKKRPNKCKKNFQILQ